MDPVTTQTGRPTPVESWDDDNDFDGIDDLRFRSFSTNTVGTVGSTRRSHHRDSLSSRLSNKSDLDEEGELQVLLPSGDELSTQVAIADAKNKGVPIPANVPSSALVGGTIKRLGGKKVKRVLGEEWGDDLELPGLEQGGLSLKLHEAKEFPDLITDVSVANSTQPVAGPSFMERLKKAEYGRVALPGAAALDKFKDTTEDDDFGDVPTIKIAKSRMPLMLPNFRENTPAPKQPPSAAEDFEDDFELPPGRELKLSARKEPPKTPASQTLDEFDPDWADDSHGSLGTSLGTRRTNRSSSVSALSPSVFSPSLSSCLTAESEDEGLDGLVLPHGPLKLEEALKKRMETVAAEADGQENIAPKSPITEDFLAGIELGDGEVYDTKKLTLNRNIKAKVTRTPSPTRRTAMTLTFTNKPTAVNTRIPKPTGLDRPRSKLEPVSESGGPIATYKRSQSRLAPHFPQAAGSAIPTATAPTPASTIPPSTPNRRPLAHRFSREALRPEPTTTSNQLLRSKRSMPALGSRFPASPSRTQLHAQSQTSRTDRFARPKTPVDRIGNEPIATNIRKPLPPAFVPSNTNLYGQQATTKPARTFHRPTSSDTTSNENLPVNRPISRLSRDRQRPTTPSARKGVAPESLVQAAASKKTLTKPQRRQAYGDGNELDIFDDLPTSAASESRFVKHPTSSLSKGSSALRNKLYSLQNQSTTSVSRVEATAVPRTPLVPQRHDTNVPSWARDTAASRLARQQRMGNVQPPVLRPHPPAVDRGLNAGPTLRPPPSTPAKAPSNVPRPPASASGAKRPSRRHKQHKPYLIQGLGPDLHKAKEIQGMHYNPELYRWEGNENALAPFNAPASPRHAVQHPFVGGGGGGAPGLTSTPTSSKPALIASVGAVKGIQVVSGMVFDPQQMRWLKMAPSHGGGHGAPSTRGRSESGERSLATDDDDDDPFAGLDDLEDETTKSRAAASSGAPLDDVGAGSSDDERTLGEEFDVGPEFARRQQREEDRWRRKLQGWEKVMGEVSRATMLAERSAIRELLKH